MPTYDPYAPPRDLPPPVLAPAALPEGIRRHALDVEGYRAFVARLLRAQIVRTAVVGMIYLGALSLWLPDVSFLVTAVPVFAAITIASALFARFRLGRLEAKALRSYEVMVSPRVIRRASLGLPPAEIAAPEVTSIVELADGLSIAGRTRRLFLTRAIGGYAEIRDHVRAWQPIESRVGVRAVLRKATHRIRGKVYDPAHDAVILSDPSLGAELNAVRALAMPIDPRSTGRRFSWRLLVLIVLIVLFFVSIWEFLAPENAPRRRTRSGDAGVGALLGLVVDDRVA